MGSGGQKPEACQLLKENWSKEKFRTQLGFGAWGTHRKQGTDTLTTLHAPTFTAQQGQSQWTLEKLRKLRSPKAPKGPSWTAISEAMEEDCF